MSDKDAKDTEPVPGPPPGYVPVAEESDLPTGQWVGEKGEGDAKEVHPTPDEVRQAQLDALDVEGGSASPDTAAAGAEHKDR